MRFLDRVATLIKADAHGVVESIEDRALLLKQYVREAEIELDRKRARMQALEGEHQRLAGELARLADGMGALDADITLALENDQDDLARFAIKKILPLRRDKAAVEGRLADIEAEMKEITDVVGTQEAELEELKAKVRAHLAAIPANDTDPVLSPGPVADEEIEIELLHRRRQLNQEVA